MTRGSWTEIDRGDASRVQRQNLGRVRRAATADALARLGRGIELRLGEGDGAVAEYLRHLLAAEPAAIPFERASRRADRDAVRSARERSAG